MESPGSRWILNRDSVAIPDPGRDPGPVLSEKKSRTVARFQSIHVCMLQVNFVKQECSCDHWIILCMKQRDHTLRSVLFIWRRVYGYLGVLVLTMITLAAYDRSQQYPHQLKTQIYSDTVPGQSAMKPEKPRTSSAAAWVAFESDEGCIASFQALACVFALFLSKRR